MVFVVLPLPFMAKRLVYRVAHFPHPTFEKNIRNLTTKNVQLLSLALLNKTQYISIIRLCVVQVPGSLFFQLTAVAFSPFLFPILPIPTCWATFVIRSTILHAQRFIRPASYP